MQQLIEEQMKSKLSKQEILRTSMEQNNQSSISSGQQQQQQQRRSLKFLGIFQRSWNTRLDDSSEKKENLYVWLIVHSLYFFNDEWICYVPTDFDRIKLYITLHINELMKNPLAISWVLAVMVGIRVKGQSRRILTSVLLPMWNQVTLYIVLHLIKFSFSCFHTLVDSLIHFTRFFSSGRIAMVTHLLPNRNKY